MAIRDVRTYFYLRDERREFALNKELWVDFNFYMDAVMRGRFKAYSGREVEGVNIVNLKLFEPGYLQGHRRQTLNESWHRINNTYEHEAYFDFDLLLSGDHVERLRILVETFLSYAKASPLPQMQALTSHTRESIGQIDMTKVIGRAARYKAAHGLQ